MRVFAFALAACALLSPSCVVRQCAAQQESREVRVATSNPAVQQAPKFSFVLFWRENDAPTQSMTNGLKVAIGKRNQRAELSVINIADPANREIVDRYQVGRAPMPLVLCVAPNGAITGTLAKQVSDEAVERLIVTPAMADVTKALQDKKLCIVHVTRDSKLPLPTGASELVADPLYQARTVVVTIAADDQNEARFLKDLAIIPAELNGSLLVVFAPPGVAVGKFDGQTSADQIAAALHAAGKCCNDPNCKHNQAGK